MKKIDPLVLRGYLFSLLLAIFTYMFFVLTINNDNKYFVIPVRARYPDDLVAFTPLVQSVNITVKGSPAILARITKEDMSAIIDFSDVREAGTVRKEVELIRAGVFQQINNVEITLQPRVVEMSLEAKVTKQVNITPSFVNSSPRGYLFKNYRTIPSLVEISGPQSIISDVATINTENIDLSLYTQSLNRTVRLIIPDYISFVTDDADSIRVYLEIEPIIIVETYNNLPIVVRNLDNRFTLQDPLPRVTLVVQGRQLAIERLSPEIYIDLSSTQRSGRYTLKTQSDIPKSVETISITPETIRIDVINATTPQGQDSTSTPPTNEQPELAPSPNSRPETIPQESPSEIPTENPVPQAAPEAVPPTIE